jgi:ubiquinone/menaquinone biosynthesis C-methylase UbiE
MLDESALSILRAPHSGEILHPQGGNLVTLSGATRFEVAGGAIPVFAPEPARAESRQQKEHYDAVCQSYLDNLTYPHTQEYFAYLDESLFQAIGVGSLGRTLEVCCGRGEALALCADRIEVGLGVDISLGMLKAGRARLPDRFTLAQGDATQLPIADSSLDTVITLGGIHHINDRSAMFGEIFRVLKPGGRFIWREPVSDLWLWRALRAIIYRLSPALDAETEHPLQRDDTVPVLDAAGFHLDSWRTFGFFGFCLFMNSDVLLFNRLFRFVPGIRAVTRLFARIDDWITSRRLLSDAGLQVIGVARKPTAVATVSGQHAPRAA